MAYNDDKAQMDGGTADTQPQLNKSVTGSLKRRIADISVLQAGKTAALLYAGIGAVFGVIMLVASGFQEEGGGKQAVTAIFMPVILSATGFIGVMAVAAFYNIIAKRFGGFEFTIAVEPFPPTQGFPFLDPRPRIDVNDEIRALAKLKEEGLITEDEFTKRKQAILNM